MANRELSEPKMIWCLGAILAVSFSMTGCTGSNSYGPPPPPVLSISSASLSDGTMGAAYAQTIQATGGMPPFNWSVSSGALPLGLMLVPSSSNSVMVSGTPSAAQTGVAFTIQVTDASGQSANQGYAVTIKSTVAQTNNGAVQGVLVPCAMQECTPSSVLEFLGIPYATQPVGDLRWKPPLPPTPSETQQPGTRCMFVNGAGVVKGQEDCLYLNVFIPSQTPHGQQQPVMVYIHGGANRKGAGIPGFDFSDPPELATQGVILVTLEYRLGILGFFTNTSLDAESASGSSGNYGLRDQIAALAWVQQNIASFGGDPTRVMVFGLSSGSSDIQALLTSPLTQGPSSLCGPSQSCFSAAAMEGGSVVHGQYLTLAAKEAQDAPLVAGLSCKATDLVCLRTLLAATLVNNPSTAYQTWYAQDPVLIVNLEPDVVPVNPLDWLQQHGSPVPLLLGSNREDASMGTVPTWCVGVTLPAPQCPTEDPTVLPQIDEPTYENAINAEAKIIGGGVTGTEILGLYPGSNFDAPVWALIAVDSDLTVGASCPYREVARAAAGANGAPVWRYIYTHAYENDPNLTPYRAFHGAELSFVFGDPSFGNGGSTHTPTQAELTLSGQMMGYWSRFAATGNPNGSGATAWPRYDATDAMLQIDDTSTEISGANSYRKAQCDFYDLHAAALANVQ
jgi:para-nitrobenzyl esterase